MLCYRAKDVKLISCVSDRCLVPDRDEDAGENDEDEHTGVFMRDLLLFTAARVCRALL